MNRAPNGTILHYLDKLCAGQDTRALSDGQLLERFVAQGDEAAFAILLQRHGPLVLRVCRQVLRHDQDAEDAFQATFLVLALRAPSIRKGQALGSWLYGVARRTAQAAERRTRRRRKYEQRVEPTPSPPVDDASSRELQEALDEETHRLPEKYHLPLLCCLEGKSRQEAARDLGWPEGTLSSRLAEARRLLRERLAQRGFVLPAMAAGLAVTAVPSALARKTVHAALALVAGNAATPEAASAVILTLAQGVSNAMVMSKIKVAAILILGLALLGVGAGLSAQAGLFPGVGPLAQVAGPGEKEGDRTNLSQREEDNQEIRKLEALLRTERNRAKQFRARVALARLGRPYLQYFLDGLKDRDPERRYQCLVALGELGDVRAVPSVMKLLDSKDTWEPVHAATCLRQLTGVEDVIVKRVVRQPDGSVQTEGVRRPVKDIKKDCEAWVARHRVRVRRPIEPPAEAWKYTPEPALPGLKVAFTMKPKQVLDVYKQAGLACKYTPEKRWQNKGNSFYSPEMITAEQSCLPALNVGLVGITYVFEDSKLHAVRLTRTGHGEHVIEPLKRPLRLRRQGVAGWTGLDDTIVVVPSIGDAEKETVEIRLHFRR